MTMITRLPRSICRRQRPQATPTPALLPVNRLPETGQAVPLANRFLLFLMLLIAGVGVTGVIRARRKHEE